MQSIDTHFLSQISGGRDRSFRSPQFQSNSGWSVEACTNLGYVNDTLSVGSFTAGFIPGGQGVALIGGTLGMIGFALDKQFCQ